MTTNRSFSTLTGSIARGLGAGPLTTFAASATLNSDWWHGQIRCCASAFHFSTVQPVWVHTAENTMTSPAAWRAVFAETGNADSASRTTARLLSREPSRTRAVPGSLGTARTGGAPASRLATETGSWGLSPNAKTSSSPGCGRILFSFLLACALVAMSPPAPTAAARPSVPRLVAPSADWDNRSRRVQDLAGLVPVAAGGLGVWRCLMAIPSLMNCLRIPEG